MLQLFAYKGNRERSEKLCGIPGREVEEEESVEGKSDGCVVDEGDVQVGLARVPVAVVVEAVRLKPDRDDRHGRLDDAELNKKVKCRD